MDRSTSKKTVLDAIFDQVEESPKEQNSTAATLFRARALDQLDVAKDVDSRLVLVSRQVWLAICAIFLVVAAGVVWAAFTPLINGVNAVGRIDTDGNAIVVVPESEGLQIVPGLQVKIPGGEPGAVIGRGEVLWPEDVQDQVMVAISGTQPLIPVALSLPVALPTGTPLAVEIVIRETTVLKRLLDWS